MKYSDFKSKNERIHDKLLEFHRVFQKKDMATLGEGDFPKHLMKWINKLFKDQCGIGVPGRFKCKTIWSKVNGPKNGALFETYFRADIYLNGESDKVGYILALSTHNTQADTDMSDGIIMHINFEVYKNKFISNYSYHF